MASMIPRLRKAGVYVERGHRPASRGIRYRLYRRPDETVAIVYSRDELAAWTAHLLDGAPRPRHPLLGSTRDIPLIDPATVAAQLVAAGTEQLRELENDDGR